VNEQIKLLEELNQIVTIVRRIKYNPVGLKMSQLRPQNGPIRSNP